MLRGLFVGDRFIQFFNTFMLIFLLFFSLFSLWVRLKAVNVGKSLSVQTRYPAEAKRA